jgi:hypothetical protein
VEKVDTEGDAEGEAEGEADDEGDTEGDGGVWPDVDCDIPEVEPKLMLRTETPSLSAESELICCPMALALDDGWLKAMTADRALNVVLEMLSQFMGPFKLSNGPTLTRVFLKSTKLVNNTSETGTPETPAMPQRTAAGLMMGNPWESVLDGTTSTITVVMATAPTVRAKMILQAPEPKDFPPSEALMPSPVRTTPDMLSTNRMTRIHRMSRESKSHLQ